MVKVKNKKRISSDTISAKKDATQKKKLNPFEVHINKEKIKVLGRKLKNDRGLPGIARAKALSKRKHTLLPEYNLQHKSNIFHDKRIGERDQGLSAEDKSIARFTAMKVKQHSKKSIFNLADDEVLTHRGQTLSEIEKFDDPRSDDDEEDDMGMKRGGNLDSNFVDDVHFGGGMLKKSEGKSHKDLIEQLILESKKRKAEMQKQKEATLELTEKLDSEWKDLMPLVNKKKKTDEEPVEKKKPDDFDKVMRELRFEARGIPSDKLKTEDEIAREEKEKLERLERERLERMRGVIDEPRAVKHRSADDLDDNFAYDDEEITDDVTLSYNEEGKSNVKLDLMIGNKDKVTAEDQDDDSNEEDDDSEDEDTEDDLSDLKASDSETDNEEIKPQEEQSDEEESDSEKDEEETKTNVADLQDKKLVEDNVVKTPNKSKKHIRFEDNDSEEENCDESKDNDEVEMEDNLSIQLTKKESSKQSIATKGILKNAPKIEEKEPPVKKTPEEIKEDLMRRKEMMEQARNELPFTFALPDSYESLQNILQGKTPEAQGIIIERMIKCNHPSLKEGNKEQLGLLFVYMLQYLNDLCSECEDAAQIKETFSIFSNLTPHFFDLAQLNPQNAASSFVEVIKEKQHDFRGKKSYPGLEVLIYFKLISCLFSTSDFRHAVVTPTITFIEGLLTRSKVRNKRDISYGIFLVCIILEYTILSKRYLPATIQFLNGILHMAIPKLVRVHKICPQFKKDSSLLVTQERIEEYVPKLDVTDLIDAKISEKYKHITLHVAVSLLKRFYQQFNAFNSCYEIFEGSLHYLKLLPLDNYSAELKREITNFIEILDELKTNRKLEYLQFEKRRPKALRLYEPNIVRVFDGKTHKVQSKEKAERDKLLYKLKKEKKGALREIRRDKAFIGKVKLDKKLASDAERREKVKRIYSEAAAQQSELNALDRSNDRKKKK